MGEPIKLVKGKQKKTVYGKGDEKVHKANGWRSPSAPPKKQS